MACLLYLTNCCHGIATVYTRAVTAEDPCNNGSVVRHVYTNDRSVPDVTGYGGACMIWEMQHAHAFRHMRVHELELVEGGKTFEGR